MCAHKFVRCTPDSMCHCRAVTSYSTHLLITVSIYRTSHAHSGLPILPANVSANAINASCTCAYGADLVNTFIESVSSIVALLYRCDCGAYTGRCRMTTVDGVVDVIDMSTETSLAVLRWLRYLQYSRC